MKRILKFIGDTSWWKWILLFPIVLGLAISFTASVGSPHLEDLGNTPEMKAAIRHEAKKASGELALGVAKNTVVKIRAYSDNPDWQAELDNALKEIEQAKIEIGQAKQEIEEAKKEATDEANQIIKDAQQQIKDAQGQIEKAKQEIEKATRAHPPPAPPKPGIPVAPAPPAPPTEAGKEKSSAEKKKLNIDADLSFGDEPKNAVKIGIGGSKKGPINIHIGLKDEPLKPGEVLPELPAELKQQIHSQVNSDARRVVIGGLTIAMIVLLFPALLITKGVISVNRRLKNRAAKSEQKAQQADLTKQLMEAKLAAMQAQIEPHFLFNTLASVQHLIETDPPAAAKMQNNLIKYLRAAIPQMRESSTTLGREAEQARAYLDILKVRMGERLSYDINIPDALQSLAFPPMMIPTLVENAIKHGLEPKLEGGKISVNATVVGDRLRVSVVDNGNGFSNQPGAGVGLENVRERLKALYGDKAAFIIMPNLPTGTVATIEVPYAKK
ncbi:MAG: histidine kinase [Burkholderiales bacterium]